jgi:hypothetical protein
MTIYAVSSTSHKNDFVICPRINEREKTGVKIYPKNKDGGYTMVHQTAEKLYQMRLDTMAAAFKEDLEQPSTGSLGFEERFAMIVDREWTSRENRKLTKRLKAARLRLKATVEDIDYRHPRGLDKSVMRSLITCQWIKSHQLQDPQESENLISQRHLQIKSAVTDLQRFVIGQHDL